MITYARVRKSHVRQYERKFSPLFWRFKGLWDLVSFHRRREEFLLRERIWTSRESFSIFRQVYNLVALRILAAACIVATLKVVEHYGYEFGILHRNWINENAQLSFFTTLMQVSGALLGLYFTAISVVASTAYNRAPGSIRSLIIHERVGHLYFRSLAFLTATTTIMATVLSLNRSIGVLNTAFASALCVFSIFGFVALGLKTFDLFDPAFLVPFLQRQLAKSIKAVTPTGLHFEDPSFQDYQRKIAAGRLGDYEGLVSLAAQDDNLDKKALVKLGAGLFYLLRLYSTQKGAISTTSYWFKRDAGHKNWLLASHNEVEVALETSTSLRPDDIPDNLWFERRICDIIAEIIRKLHESSDTSGLNTLGLEFRATMACYGQTFGVDEGPFVFRRIGMCLRAGQKLLSADDLEAERRQKALEQLSVVDLEGASLVEFTLNLRNEVERQNLRTLAQAFDAYGVSRRRINLHGLPRSLIEEIEDVRQKLLFEKGAYGHEVTPQWYVHERLAFRMCSVIVALSSRLVELHEQTFDERLASLLTAKSYFIAAQLVQRGLESCRKAFDALEVFETTYNSLRNLDKSKDYKWAQADWKSLRERLEASRAKMVRTLPEIGPWLSLLPESQAVPDYFGFAYTVTAEECFRAMATGDLALFTEIFPRYLGMSRLAANRIQQSLNKFVDPNTALIADPFLDLVSVSGYAAIYSDLFKKDFWSVVTETWNQFLNSLENQAPGFIKSLSTLGASKIGMSPREMLRFKWKMATENILREHGVGKRDYFGSDVPEPPPDTTALLRAFAHSTMVDADAIFQAQYLFKRADARRLKIPQNVKTFNDTMQRYIDRGAP